MSAFRDSELRRLAESGWVTCPSVARHLLRCGLPVPDAGYLGSAITARQWEDCESAVIALRRHYNAARFADEAEFGLLLVPDPGLLDTRTPLVDDVRRDQRGGAAGDRFDRRLGAGVLGVKSARPWNVVASVTGLYGLSLGSWSNVRDGSNDGFFVLGVDTRRLMLRQIWGARVLQSGRTPPNCELNDHWTFTIFPAEAPIGGLVESGTVLKGHVRVRLGKADRGIGPARVAPAIAID